MKTKRYNLKKGTNGNKVTKMFYSGFCVTDNKNFAIFNPSKNFFVDNHISDDINFNLTEDDLWILIDRSKTIESKEVNNNDIFFENYGSVNLKFLNLIKTVNKENVFCIVTEWFGKMCNRLIAVLPDKESKPIGILKLVNTGD